MLIIAIVDQLVVATLQICTESGMPRDMISVQDQQPASQTQGRNE